MKSLFLPMLAVLAVAAPAVHAQTTVRLGVRLGGNLATRAGSDPTFQPLTSNGTPVPNSVQDYKRTALLAPQFGAVLDVRFGKLAVQPAVLFSQKGTDQRLSITSSNSSGGYTSSTSDQYHTISRPNYLEIPFNLVYTSGTDHGFQLFAGPYVAFGMGGRAEYENTRVNSSTSGNNTGTSGGYGYGYSYSNFYSGGTSLFQYKDDYPGPPSTILSYPGNTSATLSSTPFAASSGYTIARRFDAGLNAGVGYRRGPLQVQLGYGLGLINQQPGKAADQRDDLPAYYQRVAQLTATYFVKTQ
ncbi:hypothetical protein ACVWYF_001147 [Hymenobacter sp. UYAg731]